MAGTGATGAVAKRLRNIRHRAGVSFRDLAQLLDTAPETVSRWNTAGVEPHRRTLQRILELEWLAERLSEIYPQPDEARLWLLSRHRLLGGDTPANRIQKGDLEDVLALIAQITDGAYV